MSKKVFDKLRQATNTARTSFFKPKTTQQEEPNLQTLKQPRQKDSTNKDGQKPVNRLKMFANMAQEKLKSMNSSQMNYMKKKLNEMDPKSKLKEMDLKDSLKEGANKLKDSSKQMMDNIKEQVEKLDSAKDHLTSSVFNKIEEAKKSLQGSEDKEELTQQGQVRKWFDRQVHDSQANWKALQEMIRRQLKLNNTERFNIVQRVFQKLYWKMLFLLFFIVFAYGFGSAIPREIRKALEKSDKSKELKDTKESMVSKEVKA